MVGLVWCFLVCSALLATLPSSAIGQFVVSPSNQEPVEGDRLSVPCSTENAMFTVWYKEGKIITSSPHFSLPNSNFGSSSTLTIETANHTLHTGHYECVAIFQDSSEARVAFHITVKYIEQTIHLDFNPNCSTGYNLESGCELRLECFPPTGYPEVRVLWYRNGVKIRQALAVMSGIDFAHKKRVLSIRNATYDDSGSYQCRANNGIGVTRSSRLVNVTVQGEGRGLMFAGNVTAENVTVREGAMLSLDCSVEDAVGGVMFQWLVEGEEGGMVKELRERRRINITSSANSSSLLIHKVVVVDEGMYYCIAADFISQITKQIKVSVKVPRAIVQWPLSEVQGSEGERTQFDCIASGRPAPVVTWFFQSAPVPLAPAATDSGLQDLGNGSLLIPVLRRQHAGTYICMLQQPPLDIRTFTLTVIPLSPPLPSLPPSPSGNSTITQTVDFTIGPFSQTVSVVLVAVCGLFPLLLCSALLISLYCCCRARRSRLSQKRILKLETAGVRYNFSSRNHASHSWVDTDSGVPPVRERQKMELPLPPAPPLDSGGVCHYEEVEEVALTVSGMTRLRLPTFSSDTSEAATTELETEVSAVTDTELVIS